MSTSEMGLSGVSVTLDQLVALNEEMAALVRSGVPLERGLIEAGRDIHGRLGEIARDLGGRLEQGERLTDAIARTGSAMPDIYRAVVEAGLRSGRLSSALEGMASLARGHADARRAVGMALFYPLLVLALAYVLAVGFVLQIAPRFVAGFESLRLSRLASLAMIARAGDSVVYWGPIVPILLLLVVWKWVQSGRSSALNEGRLGAIIDRIPAIGSMSRSFRSANFADLLVLLIEHQVPLDEALRLAGDASGNRAMREASHSFAEAIRRGEGPSTSRPTHPKAFPPLLSWIVTEGRQQRDIAPALRQAARVYRRRAETRAEVFISALPTVMMVGIGAVVVLLYAMLLFLPMTALWNDLSMPVNF